MKATCAMLAIATLRDVGWHVLEGLLKEGSVGVTDAPRGARDQLPPSTRIGAGAASGSGL